MFLSQDGLRETTPWQVADRLRKREEDPSVGRFNSLTVGQINLLTFLSSQLLGRKPTVAVASAEWSVE